MLHWSIADRTALNNRSLEGDVLSLKMNKGPGSADLLAKYAAMERTGQSGWFM